MKKTMLVLVALLLGNTAAFADDSPQRYAVTITNVTAGQTFTPMLVVTHKPSVGLFELGEPASDELALVAESGDIGPLAGLLGSLPQAVYDTADSGGLLFPGDSVTVYVDARGQFDRVSLVGMLIPTNDTFVALDSVPLSRKGRTVMVPAYDAGSEFNDENCANIPGPTCGGAGASPGSGEGYVHISNGIHGVGDLAPAVYDWRNPVARITVKRVKQHD